MVSISFLGDISLNDNYIYYYRNNIEPFINLESQLHSQDYVIGNLECLAKGVKGENELKKPRLTTEVKTLNFIKNINLRAATFAHNHFFDHLKDGFIKTTSFLEQNKVDFLGASIFSGHEDKPLLKNINGISFCFLNYVTHDTNPNFPEDADVYLNYFDIEKVKNDIVNYGNGVDYTILLLHWGAGLKEVMDSR